MRSSNQSGTSGRWLLLAAAGRGTRSGLSRNKVFEPIAGVCSVIRCLAAFSRFVEGAVIVIGADDANSWEAVESVASSIMPISTVVGGATRTESVLHGLSAVPSEARWIAVHDAARPFVSSEVIARCFSKAEEYGAVIPAIPVNDSIISISQAESVSVPRDELRAVQTPQVFRADLLREAYDQAARTHFDATDDAELLRITGHSVAIVQGDVSNKKLTTPSDFEIAECMRAPKQPQISTGFGIDAHCLALGRKLTLCGVTVPHERGLLGHSDADAATHALIDALLGAARLGDIGRWFPDTDPSYKDIRSILLLERTVGKLHESGFVPVFADITIAAQRPKLAPYMAEMVGNIARALGIPPESVNVKATTYNSLGFVGCEEGIAAYALATIAKL